MSTQRSRTADIAATFVLLVVHGFVLAATAVLLGLLVMGTDPCGAVKCGDPAWIDRAMMLGIWGGAAVLGLLLLAGQPAHLAGCRRCLPSCHPRIVRAGVPPVDDSSQPG